MNSKTSDKITNILVISSYKSDLKSVDQLSAQLTALYQSFPHFQSTIINVETFNLKKLKNIKYDALAIIHPRAVRHPIFVDLIRESPIEYPIFFHIMGDYLRRSIDFISIEEYLRKRRIIFFTFSHCYHSLVSRTLITNSTRLLPPPIEKDNFFYDANIRKGQREKLKIAADEKMLIYTGRIAPQKNIVEIVRFFINEHSQNSKINRLYIIGPLENFETPTYYEKNYSSLEYYQEVVREAGDHLNKTIFIFPHFNKKQLNEYLNASDLFISFSLFHDEDLGLSPLEALSTGTPVLLTEWGGFRDLSRHLKGTRAIHYLPVSYRLNHELIVSLPKKQLNIPSICFNKSEANKISRAVKNFYSIKNIKNMMSITLNKRIPLFNEFSVAFKNFGFSLLRKETNIGNEYINFYAHFLSLPKMFGSHNRLFSISLQHKYSIPNREYLKNEMIEPMALFTNIHSKYCLPQKLKKGNDKAKNLLLISSREVNESDILLIKNHSKKNTIVYVPELNIDSYSIEVSTINFQDLKRTYDLSDWLIIFCDKLDSGLLRSTMIHHILSMGGGIIYSEETPKIPPAKSLTLSPHHVLNCYDDIN